MVQCASFQTRHLWCISAAKSWDHCTYQGSSLATCLNGDNCSYHHLDSMQLPLSEGTILPVHLHLAPYTAMAISGSSLGLVLCRGHTSCIVLFGLGPHGFMFYHTVSYILLFFFFNKHCYSTFPSPSLSVCLHMCASVLLIAVTWWPCSPLLCGFCMLLQIFSAQLEPRIEDRISKAVNWHCFWVSST